MKEATGEVSMTVITLAAIAVIGGILAIMWPTIQNNIKNLWGQNNNVAKCGAGQYWNGSQCTNISVK